MDWGQAQGQAAANRAIWALLAVVCLLTGYYLYLRAWADWGASLLIGIGAGLLCAIIGSVVHDAFARGHQPR